VEEEAVGGVTEAFRWRKWRGLEKELQKEMKARRKLNDRDKAGAEDLHLELGVSAYSVRCMTALCIPLTYSSYPVKLVINVGESPRSSRCGAETSTHPVVLCSARRAVNGEFGSKSTPARVLMLASPLHCGYFPTLL